MGQSPNIGVPVPGWGHVSQKCCGPGTKVIKSDKPATYHVQGGEGRQSKAENLRSSREIQSIFNMLGRTGKIIILYFLSRDLMMQ